MDCRVFTERIYEFILDDLNKEEKAEMKKHIEECDKCREIYNRELEIEKSLKSFFDEEKIAEEEIVDEEEFKIGVMERIDKNRYKKEKINKKHNISKYMKIVTPIAAGFFIFIITIKGSFMMGSGNMTESANDASANNAIVKEQDIEKSETSLENKGTLDNNFESDLEEADRRGESSDIQEEYGDRSFNFTINKITKEEFYTFLMEDGAAGTESIFENSPKKEYSAALLEKNNSILINNQKNGEKFILEVQFKGKFSIIKNIEWYNEGFLLIVSGNEEEGGKLVSLLNIVNNKNTKIYEVKDNKSSITDVHYIAENSITINTKVYDEENKEFHNEDIKLYSIEKVK